jgi:DNA invertase Pin-like site-specific DNA recombinase
VPTQLANAERHAGRRGWQVVARLKDDGYSAFKEIRRDDFINLIRAIERDEVDVVIVRDIDRLTRNLADWDRFEKAAIEHHVILSAYAGGDLDLSTPEGAYYGGMETLRAKRESAVRSVRVREAHDRIARQGKIPGGGPRWFGWTRVYANPDASARQRVIIRLDVNEAEAAALRDAAERILRGETLYSIVCEWERGQVRPVASGHWTVATLVGILGSPRLAGLREWQGKKYPAQWPAIIDADTHERLARLLADRPRRAQVTGKRRHLLSGVARCGKCGPPLYVDVNRYRCASGPGGGCGGVAVRADMLEEYVTGAVLDALESPCVQQAVTTGQDTDALRRAELLAEISKAQEKRAEARRDWAEDVIDKEDWLDIKQRTDDRINRARTEYDRLTGTATVFGDIPRPTRYATPGSSGTPTAAALPSKPCSTGSPSTRTPPGAREAGTAPYGWMPCASGRNSTGGSEECSADPEHDIGARRRSWHTANDRVRAQDVSCVIDHVCPTTV